MDMQLIHDIVQTRAAHLTRSGLAWPQAVSTAVEEMVNHMTPHAGHPSLSAVEQFTLRARLGQIRSQLSSPQGWLLSDVDHCVRELRSNTAA